jgi:hypothetical protein
MSYTITRLAMLLALALFISATASAQPWTLAGPDDGNQPGAISGAFGDSRAMTSDKGNGFFLAFREYMWSGPNTVEERLTVRRWNATAWQPVGPRTFSAGYVHYIDIATTPAQVPYVVYQDHSVGRKAVVAMFNGSSWVNVGSAVSPGVAERTQIVTDGAGTPYVAYVDSPASRKVTVKKWDGMSWQLVGTANFSPAGIIDLRLAIGSNGLPQVLVRYYSSGTTAEVFRYTGSVWISAGIPAIGASIETADLAIKGDTAFVAYTDNNANRRVTVRKFNGIAWTTVGPANFSPGASDNLQLEIDTTKGTYLFCNTEPNGGMFSPNTAMVRRFDGSNWIVAGPDSFVVRNPTGSGFFELDTAGTLHVLLFDRKNKLLKLTGNAWIPQGSTEGFNNAPAFSTKLVAAPDGKKAYGITTRDYYSSNPYSSHIYRYDTGWTLIGQSGAGGLKGEVIDIATHPDGNPWIVLRDSGSYNSFSLWRLTPSGWVFTRRDSTYGNIVLSIDAAGTVFTAFRPYGSSGVQVYKNAGTGWVQLPLYQYGYVFQYIRLKTNRAGELHMLAGSHVSTTPNYLYVFEVSKFNGTTWQSLGGLFNTPNLTYYNGDPDLAIDTADVPYIAYPNTSQQLAKVQKFNAAGNSWVDVVPDAATPTRVMNPEIQFAPDGSLYLSYGDRSVTAVANATVKRLLGSSWQTVGASSFTKWMGEHPTLAVLNNRLLTAFTDGAAYAYKYDCAQPAIVLSQPRDTVICSGASIMFTATGTGVTAYRWQYNSGQGWYNLQPGATYSGVSDDTLQLTNIPVSIDGTRYRCVLGNACNGTSLSDVALLRVDDVNWPAPSITITADKTAVCAGDPVTFQASAINFGVLYAFEWSINGTPVAGANNPVFTTTTLAQGDAVTCKLTRSSACGLNPVSATSNSLSIDINPTQSPTVSISPSPGIVITTGQAVTFTATVTNGGPAPQYQWYVNGNPVGGATSSTYTNSALANGFTVAVLVKRTDSCASPNTVFSSAAHIVQWPANIEDVADPHNILIYPQPARDFVRISNLNNITAGTYSLRLYDIMGRQVHEEALTIDSGTSAHQTTLPASLPAGTYRLTLTGSVKVAEATVIIAR